GNTGAGKSSLLLAICSEVEMTRGAGRLVGKIAYLEQQPRIMNDTLRANVLFGRDYDEDYYWKVLGACALIEDLEVWPNSDLTVIGKDGINISGGQRARLALARTVYSRADIYFLDDPLSAVDAIVKRYILDNIILSTGLLGDKLRFVTSNADSISTLCNQIATVDNGSVSVKVQTPQVHTVSNRSTLSANKPKMGGSPSNELQTVTYLDKKQTVDRLNASAVAEFQDVSSSLKICDYSMKYGKRLALLDGLALATDIHKPHGLDRSIYDCFGRITSGQQQLFGLCRIIMRKQKIVVLDEATANVDLETDKSVQELIRKEFSDCTVLTIAHRLETIMNSDRIIVMDKGTIAEIGTPQELLAKDGMFALLVKTSDFGQ
ncbi:ATP-binding cassette glutathione S-conjugate transporter ycf1, partial [Coemansia sp. S3946]